MAMFVPSYKCVKSGKDIILFYESAHDVWQQNMNNLMFELRDNLFNFQILSWKYTETY